MKEPTIIQSTLKTTPELADKRLDQALSILMPQYSRTLLQNWIKLGYVRVGDKVITQRNSKVKAEEILNINAQVETQEAAQPQAITLDILYEDDDIIVINKPAGLIVHPGSGCKDGTLLNALLYHDPELSLLPRAGIIHRLDKDTSGVLVITHNLRAHKILVEALQAREIKREYKAITKGQLITGGTIDAPIGRHKTKRTHMAVIEDGKDAITHYRIIHRFDFFTYLDIVLETGRTHQIRVHMAHINHPLVGDPVYGRLSLPRNASPQLQKFLAHFKRQALHAAKLTLKHPRTKKIMEFNAPLPQDFQQLLKLL